MIKTFPFYDVSEYYKAYPNFAYRIVDSTQNVFKNSNYEFGLIYNKKLNGFGFSTNKDGTINGGEVKEGNLLRQVQLPQSYLQKANSILSEITNASNIALDAQRKALIIKEKYKKKICKDSIKVNFMANDEYKSICRENEKIAKLKEKIDIKLAEINKQKQLKMAQQNQQRMIRAREMEAAAAQRQAAAAEQANNQASWDSLNRSIQNMNNNMQMQQLNNNLMMYNYMPKTHHLYIH